MSIDYDLHVINTNNLDTTMSQFRECVADAIENLKIRLEALEALERVQEPKPRPHQFRLIKDEKIRKAVRVWAETVGRKDLLVIKIGGRLEISDGSPHLIYISFQADEATLKSLDDRTYYTIEELCGEEEE